MKGLFASILFYVIGYSLWVWCGDDENVIHAHLYNLWDKICYALSLVIIVFIHKKLDVLDKVIVWSIIVFQILRMSFELIGLSGNTVWEYGPRILNIFMIFTILALLFFSYKFRRLSK